MSTAECRAIDIHKTEKKYESALRKLEQNKDISKVNKKFIFDFLYDCQIGKTVLKRAKKRIKPNRLIKYLYTLKQVSKFLNKDFDKVTQKEMEEFIRKLDNNSLTSVCPDGKIINHTYTQWTRHDIKVVIRKFYKWLWGNNIEYPELVSWIDTHVEESDPPSLSIEEIRCLADHATAIKGKAIVWTLFETGARISELLNVRLHHVADKEKYYLIRIEFSKTFKRTLPIFEGQNYLRDWLANHPQKNDLNSQLFPITYAAILAWMKRLGKKALNKGVNPHLLRHSYATWLAGKKVGRYQMCKLMGWAMSSDMLVSS